MTQPLPATVPPGTRVGSPPSNVSLSTVQTILLSAAGTYVTAKALLALLGLPDAALESAASVLRLMPRPGNATDTEVAQDFTPYRAAYVVAAIRRVWGSVKHGDSLQTALAREKPFYLAHVRASRNRQLAAAQVLGEKQKHGDLLGWYAQMDGRTSPGCAVANGHNFSARRGTVLGLPGAAHPTCRCTAGPPHWNVGTVNAALASHVGLDGKRLL